MTIRQFLRGAIIAGWMAFVALVLIGSTADHPLRVRPATSLMLKAFVPQGWAFFTRDAQEPAQRLYRRTPRGLVRSDYTNSSHRNLFGLRKDTRPIAIELIHLLNQVPPVEWHECEGGSIADCLSVSGATAVAVVNESRTRRHCGEIIVDERRPVPWAWSRSVTSDRMPSRHLVLDARC